VDQIGDSQKVENLEDKESKKMESQTFAGLEKHNSREDFQHFFFSTETFNKLSETCVNGDGKKIHCRWTAWRAWLGLLTVGDEAKTREQVKKAKKILCWRI